MKTLTVKMFMAMFANLQIDHKNQYVTSDLELYEAALASGIQIIYQP